MRSATEPASAVREARQAFVPGTCGGRRGVLLLSNSSRSHFSVALSVFAGISCFMSRCRMSVGGSGMTGAAQAWAWIDPSSRARRPTDVSAPQKSAPVLPASSPPCTCPHGSDSGRSPWPWQHMACPSSGHGHGTDPASSPASPGAVLSVFLDVLPSLSFRFRQDRPFSRIKGCYHARPVGWLEWP